MDRLDIQFPIKMDMNTALGIFYVNVEKRKDWSDFQVTYVHFTGA